MLPTPGFILVFWFLFMLFFCAKYVFWKDNTCSVFRFLLDCNVFFNKQSTVQPPYALGHVKNASDIVVPYRE